MPKAKGKKREVSDSDSDSGPEDRGPAPKKPAPSKSSKSDSTEERFVLTKTRFVTVSKFKGSVCVDIREFYDKDGEMMPGRKGIMLKAEQYQKFKELIPEIDKAMANL